MRWKFQDADQWKWIFIIAAIFYMTDCITFWVMSSGEVQDWAVSSLGEVSALKNQTFDSLDHDVNRDEEKDQILDQINKK